MGLLWLQCLDSCLGRVGSGVVATVGAGVVWCTWVVRGHRGKRACQARCGARDESVHLLVWWIDDGEVRFRRAPDWRRIQWDVAVGTVDASVGVGATEFGVDGAHAG